MRDKTYHAYLDSHERQIVIHSLVELKNQLIQQGRYTDCVECLLILPQENNQTTTDFKNESEDLTIEKV